MRRIYWTIALLMLSVASLRAQTVTASITTAPNPSVVATDPATNKIYVGAPKNDVPYWQSIPSPITVIDGTTNVATTISDPNTHFTIGFGVNPVTRKIYAADYTGHITVIDEATNTYASIELNEPALAVAANPVTNKIYVIAWDNIVVIDGATNTFTTIDWPWGEVGPDFIAVNPVTNKIYVGNGNGMDGLWVIDGATNAGTFIGQGGVDGDYIPISLTINPVTNKIYFGVTGTAVVGGTSYNLDAVEVVDGATGTVTSVPVPSPPAFLSVNPVTNKIYIATGGEPLVMDGATNSVSSIATVWLAPGDLPSSLPPPPTSQALVVNAVTNQIYVANGGSNSFTVVDGATNNASNFSAGNIPSALAINPVTNKVYVANSGSTGPGGVTVIDGSTYPTATVSDPSANYPQAIAVNPATNQIYVANYGSNTVTAIDGATNTPTSVNVGLAPWALDVNPYTNQVYVANSGSNFVTVIDGATNSPTMVADPNAKNPWAVAVNPATNLIYVANNGSGNVTVIDGTTNLTTTVTDPYDADPWAVAVNPATNQIYVANLGGTVTVIDGATNHTTSVSVPSPIALAVNPLTNKIYVASFQGTAVTVIDGVTDATTSIGVGNGCGNAESNVIAVNPATNKIYAANCNDNTVTVIDGATNNTTTVSAGPGIQGLAVNAATNQIYVADSEFRETAAGYTLGLTVIDGASNTTTTPTNAGGNYGAVAVAVNPVTNLIYTAYTWTNNVSVISPHQINAIPLAATISPLPDNLTSSLTPSFNFTAASSFVPYATVPDNVEFQLDTWQGLWASSANAGSGSFTGTFTAPLQPGAHILYAYATDGQEGSSNMTGNQPLIGNITAYPFAVNPGSALLTPGSLAFGNQASYTPSNSQSVTLSNRGGGPLSVSSVVASGDYTATSCSTIDAGTSCTIEVTFTPTVTGTDNGTLTITDNSQGVNGTTHIINLTGTGVAAATTTAISAPAVSYGTNGLVTVTVTSPAGAVTGSVTLSVDSGAAVAQALASGSTTFTLTGLAVGTHTLSASYAAQGNFPASSTTGSLQVNPATPTVTFTGAPASAAYDATFSVAATTNASTTAVITASGACSNAGSSITMTSGTGTCNLTATWAADANYSAATATQSTTAQTLAQTITFNPPASPATYNASFGVAPTSSSGLTVNVAAGGACSISSGTVLMTSGTGLCTLTASQAGNSNYSAATSVIQTVTAQKAAATVALSNLTQTYTGSGLAPTATTTPEGLATVWTGAPDTAVGNYPVTATVNDPNYQGSASGTFNITKAAQAVTFTGAPASAAYESTFVVAATTNASTTAVITASGACSASGFTVTMTAATGTCKLAASWPADSNYLAASATQSTLATRATPAISWPAPAAIAYGTALTSRQLDATATYQGSSVGGAFVYAPARGVVLGVGIQTLSVTFTPTNTTRYTTATGTVTLQVNQATPKITWAKPAAITYGTALSGTQLDASTTVTGTFAYSPAPGTLLNAGAGQTLSVTFTPDDTTDDTAATDSVLITVNEAISTATITSISPNPSVIGQAVTVNFTVAGTGVGPTGSVTVTASSGQTCSNTLVTGAGSCSLTFTKAGSPTLTAKYGGDGNFKTSTSAKVTQTVQK